MKIYKNPQDLTPNQKKWMERYLKLSGDPIAQFLLPPIEYHEVYEWENGWIDYSIRDEQFWVWTLYSHRDSSDDGLKRGKSGDAIDIGVTIAKKNGCKYIDFDTHRDDRAWEMVTKKYGKTKVISRQIRLTLTKEKA
tara:strand:- start:529 stop:939 length:411 start_codon:yes stop_codon:yes gene_type:complete